jgi:hypothetical protein
MPIIGLFPILILKIFPAFSKIHENAIEIDGMLVIPNFDL